MAGVKKHAPGPKILLVTNDFPPTVGGIQSYLADFVGCLDPDSVIVFASTQDAEAARAYDAQVPYRVVRYPGAVMLPTPAVARRMRELIAAEGIEVVWFGAAAPLGLLASAARAAGARRIVASTHGHEVGWSMVPVARQLLRRIGSGCDVVTFISDYTLGRLRGAFGPATTWMRMPSGVDADFFAPVSDEARDAVLRRFGLNASTPLVVCCSRLVARKGQDQLIRSWPAVRQVAGDAHLLFVGQGPYRGRLEKLRAGLPEQCRDSVMFCGRLDRGEMRDLLASAWVAATPCRTRGAGLDVEGLGIVFLEAQACGVPVIAGDSGGAPETVGDGAGVVVSGRDTVELANQLIELLSAPAQHRRAMGRLGRQHVQQQWSWGRQCARLKRALGL
ncbi:glycosyltransferase family 4 protein [Corynebacterium aquilae]|uniref:GDP-mannose-dependent alpha-(1-6)-phosphatidylinositol monomannoside mannosyltransferase n=1 Tax=Corynebacterium aquilae DSM 44791 TaxID=1431546 RepID=A0A1L7CH15_9CORY|nr:glycosyltransferase family 4 protein [Corynebacterium aquilae]APT85115.1 GDP-mannose-dependent alpha-(1-6)-phosphatidylinositol monomannoside mannosyltransferase [Corynebacterium aquilae DSM 44791]